jgi:metallo-beta-lactamase family protein
MCTGGRIKHHLKFNLGRPESTVLFVGYQAEGTLGRQLLNGAHEIRIHHRMWKVHARKEQIHGLSAHADHDDLLRWLGGFERAPTKLFLTHGEEDVSLSLAYTVRSQYGWEVEVPAYGQVNELA